MLVDLSTVAALAVAALSSGVLYFIKRLREQRRWYTDNDVPKAPHDWFWGHAKLVGEYAAKTTGDYMQAAWTQIIYDFKLPEVSYLDMWPFGPEFIVCSGPESAALATTTNSFAQAEIVTQYFSGVKIGAGFIEATNGPLWKELHQMLAPGLTPAATKTYSTFIFDEAERLHNRIRDVAAAGQPTDMAAHLGRYPFSIIWRVFFGEEFQRPDLHDITRRFADISPAVPPLNPITAYRWKRERAVIVAKLEAEIVKSARARFEQMKTWKSLPTRTTAACLLDRMLLGHVQAGLPFDDRLMTLVKENGKGMLAAGFGTTTDTFCYIIMLLSVFPSALATLRAEHNRIFPPDLPGTIAALRADPSLTKELAYTTAVIQETLRLFPIGMVVRVPPPGMTSFEINGKTYPVKPNHMFGILGYPMHYNPDIFPNPTSFEPERFLGFSEGEKESAAFPRSAYRPFERGLRSCMGQNLAMEEMRIALVVVARFFDFELVDHHPVQKQRLAHTDLDTKLGDHAFQKARFSAGPNGETRMKVRVVEGR